VKYLRQLLDTWRQFKVVADKKFDEENKIYSSCLQDCCTWDSLNEVDAVCQPQNFVCNELNTETSVFAENCSDNSNGTVNIENVHEVGDKNNVIECCGDGLKESNKNSIVVQTDHQSAANENGTEQIITRVSESLKSDQLSCINAKSLALIADAYGTDDDDDDDDDDDEYNNGGGDDGGGLDDNEKEEEECLSSYNSHRTYDDLRSCSLMPIARSPDNAETEENTGNSNTVDIASGNSDTVDSDRVLDRVMGMLIRVRLKFEKLWSAGLLHYDPTLVTQLLCRVEELYEQN
jgi:hypothetical protein